MMTAEQYIESLRDGRAAYIDGRRIADVTREPLMRRAIEIIAGNYTRFHSDQPGAFHPMYDMPRSLEDLRKRLAMLEVSDITAGVSAVVLALLQVAPELAKSKPVYRDRVHKFAEYLRQKDLRVCEAITDAKGDRSLSPSQQDDPDLYTRVVDRNADGIFVTGSKLHITAAALVHEIVALPTKQMKKGEEAYAVAFAVPVNSPGVKIVNTTYAPRVDDDRGFPLSRKENMPEGFIIFDRVFVPNERIFLDGEVEHSAKLAHALGLWERTGGVEAAVRQADLMVGMAELIAEANGLEKVSHIRDKINEMIIYSTMIRAGLEAAMTHTAINADGMLVPDELFTNAAKYFAAANFHIQVRNLQDIAGGSVVTSPSIADLESEGVGEYVRKYMRGRGGVSAEQRMKLFHLIRDTTADAYGGWQLVTQMMVARRHYDMEHAKALAREAAEIDEGGAEHRAQKNGGAKSGAATRSAAK
jgi:4-hydroxybutyryl-CoA dehydratase / vinylacetyl-CoA-Delta-isomerase